MISQGNPDKKNFPRLPSCPVTYWNAAGSPPWGYGILKHPDFSEEEYAHLLAEEIGEIISVHRTRFPDLHWDTIRKALTLVQAGLQVAEALEKSRHSHDGAGFRRIR